MAISEYVKINEESPEAKYQQIVRSIIHNVVTGNLVVDQKIPSINDISEELFVSRDTVEKAYNILKKKNIITSIRGKGSFVSRTKLVTKTKILFLANKYSTHKLEVFNSFINSLDENYYTDLRVYHCNETLFLNILEKEANGYDYYVVMPHFKTKNDEHTSITEEVSLALNKIPKNKLILLDNALGADYNESITVYQDFKKDVYEALIDARHKLNKYAKINLVYPSNTILPYPKRILFGVKRFCLQFNFEFEVLDEVFDDMIINKGELFIIIEDSDLVSFIKKIREYRYVLGDSVGILSYNDTPLKDVFGISVISTDFKVMGETGAKMLLNREKGVFKVPFNFLDRDSF